MKFESGQYDWMVIAFPVYMKQMKYESDVSSTCDQWKPMEREIVEKKWKQKLDRERSYRKRANFFVRPKIVLRGGEQKQYFLNRSGDLGLAAIIILATGSLPTGGRAARFGCSRQHQRGCLLVVAGRARIETTIYWMLSEVICSARANIEMWKSG